jgi:hypothetical protein
MSIKTGPKQRLSNSLNAVFRLLDTEGFSEYSAGHILRYNRKQAKAREQQMARFERNKKRLSEVMRQLSAADRLVVGKFFSAKEAMAFDAGLRIGLSARCCDVAVDDEWDDKER